MHQAPKPKPHQPVRQNHSLDVTLREHRPFTRRAPLLLVHTQISGPGKRTR
jgi:hypothetical protein